MKHIIPSLLISICIGLCPAFADTKPSLPVDGRIKIFTYTPEDVYSLITKHGYQTSVSFAPTEEINTISVGDRSLWQIIPAGNRLFVRPMTDNLSTNMTVITNRREYNFDLKSLPESGRNNLYAVQFRYPDEVRNETNANDFLPPSPVALGTGGVAIPPMDTQRTQTKNDHYSYTGSDVVAPEEVYDDGRYTYIAYDVMPTPPPTPFVIGNEGQAAIAVHKIQGNQIILRIVSNSFILRHPEGNITVYNELFHP